MRWRSEVSVATPTHSRRRVLAQVAVLALPMPWAAGAAARTTEPLTSFVQVPFAQQLDLQAVGSVVRSAPEALVATIKRHGAEVLRVRSDSPSRQVNPLLAPLPVAGEDLLRQAEFRDGYDGRVILRASSCCPRPHDLILIRETARTYTLIHEFTQSRLKPLQPGEPDDVIESRFASAFRRLSLYQRRLFDDPYRLLEPLWRRDILSAQADVARDLFARIRLGQSQEAIVERTLAQLIDERSPYFDRERRDEGLRYAVVMIDNAIDLFNTVHDSATFVADAVAHLRQAVADGQIPTGAPASLTEADEHAVRRATAETKAALEPVRTEIQVLKNMMADVMPGQRAAATLR